MRGNLLHLCLPSCLLLLLLLLSPRSVASWSPPSVWQIPLVQQASPRSDLAPAVSQDSSNHEKSISPALFAELEELARLVDIAYCVGSLGVGIGKPFECPSRCGDFEGYELITTWNTGPLLSDSCGYIARSDDARKRVVVAFRGTYSITNTVADLSTVPQEYIPYPGAEGGGGNESAPACEDCTVHTGFYTSWLNTRDVILPNVEQELASHPDYELTLVGHSLGGAVVAFAGLEFLARGWKPKITTFGEPKIGNQALADYVDQQFNLTTNHTTHDTKVKDLTYRRVTHAGDPVPLLPLQEWGYCAHSGEVFISKSDLAPDVEDVHLCLGQEDPKCIVGPGEDANKPFWTVPARFRLWELFFAHRDYFWRLGLCIPTLDAVWPWASLE